MQSQTSYRYFLEAVMWRSIFLVPVNETELGLRREGAMAQTGHVKISFIDGVVPINV